MTTEGHPKCEKMLNRNSFQSLLPLFTISGYVKYIDTWLNKVILSSLLLLLLLLLYILLDVLVCSVAVCLYELCRFFDKPVGRVKIQATS